MDIADSWLLYPGPAECCGAACRCFVAVRFAVQASAACWPALVGWCFPLWTACMWFVVVASPPLPEHGAPVAFWGLLKL